MTAPDAAEAPAAGGDPTTPAPARVKARRREYGNVWTLEIEPEDGAHRRAEPGQFNMLTAFGVGEAAFSVSQDAAEARLAHTIRPVGPVSAALAALRVGDPVGVRGPYGAPWPLPKAEGRDVIVMAGGIGLAPLRPALQRLIARRERYRRVALYYGARSPEHLLFARDLKALSARADIEVRISVDVAGREWRGDVGVVTGLIAHDGLTPDSTAFLCGPEVMMRFSAAALCDAGLDASAIHLSLERNMKCAVGFCGRCQFGPVLVCRDGPIFSYDRIAALMLRKEL